MFFIKYVRMLGFDATNDIFAENAWYFRNALVRANYNDLKHGVHETTEYLELFLRNLLLDETNELHNRTMHISGMFDMKPKADIHNRMENFMPEVSKKTIDHIMLIYDQYGNETFFGRSNVEAVFCKCFLAKVAKYFWRMLHLQIGESCKALTGSCPASRIAIADQI